MDDKLFHEKQRDLNVRKLELDIELQLLELKQKQALIDQKRRISQSILIAIIGGIAGLFGTGLNSWLQHQNEIRTEHARLKSSLILSAINTDETQKVVHTLKFLLKIKLIEDDRLDDLLKDSTKWSEIPAIDGFKSTIIAQDITNERLSGMAVFYNGTIVGTTDSIGQLSLFRSSDDMLQPDDFAFSRNGIEYEMLNSDIDSSDVTIFWLTQE